MDWLGPRHPCSNGDRRWAIHMRSGLISTKLCSKILQATSYHNTTAMATLTSPLLLIFFFSATVTSSVARFLTIMTCAFYSGPTSSLRFQRQQTH
ncbi:hypothetical protein AMELA_G00294630 [Ameiurus melas]|uniref:Uncharacterized protein n=1 Tax=Ameiurus melas TaxID=219545 RepID=A0A7J5ZHW5_AMEME|nr:hypothetical protein AMELA_G00294630 [Ameiurus melas]